MKITEIQKEKLEKSAIAYIEYKLRDAINNKAYHKPIADYYSKVFTKITKKQVIEILNEYRELSQKFGAWFVEYLIKDKKGVDWMGEYSYKLYECEESQEIHKDLVNFFTCIQINSQDPHIRIVAICLFRK